MYILKGLKGFLESSVKQKKNSKMYYVLKLLKFLK